MITFKCKMCGGDLHPEENATTCECEYCGSVQTIPTADNEKKGNLFNRANRLRMAAEYDKAAAVYTSITAEFPEEAEAYWGLCLCKYGIEYVEDPATAKKIPTCHRTRSESIMDDPDFEQACENADAIAKKVYREEAKAIDRLQQDILSVVANESPYDVFICYKETGEDGQRTEDSVLAQDIYDALTAKDLKVFFARITLEDKLGQQYEPYIYAALHSAKVMLAIGTQFEYYDAVWVKNEWARFLDMMKSDKTKTLIPCYKGIDAYDMPREFKNLQGQDMGKIGWLQDLTRGVMKLCGRDGEKTTPVVQRVVQTSGPTVDSLLERSYVFLEDGQWDSAVQYANKVLDIDVKNGQAYLVKLLAELKVNKPDDLADQEESFADNSQYKKIQRFGSESLKQQVESYNHSIIAKKKQAEIDSRIARISNILNDVKNMNGSNAVKKIEDVEKRLDDLPDSEAVQALKVRCQAERDRIRDQAKAVQQQMYSYAKKLYESATTVYSYKSVLNILNKITEFDDVESMRKSCIERIAAYEKRDIRIKEALTRVDEEYKKSVEAYKSAYQAVQASKSALDQAETEANHLREQTDRLKSEIAELKGLFTRKRRKELETEISSMMDRIREANVKLEESRSQHSKARHDLPDEPQHSELKYNMAGVYASEGLYAEAANLYREIVDYKDVSEILKTEHFTALDKKEQAAGEPAYFSDDGTTISFGRYEQEGWPGVIEWIVLDTQGNYKLLISRYALSACTVEDNVLENWAKKFFETAFSDIEREAIVDMGEKRLCDWNDNGRQKYRVFLLTRDEYDKYVNKPGWRKILPTEYAASKGAQKWGWLWPKDVKIHQSDIVTSSGGFSFNHIDRVGAIRPAIWIDTSRLIIAKE